MKQEDDAKGKITNEAKMSNKDITPVLKGWEYEAGTINVRKINGLDGSPKLQMRPGSGPNANGSGRPPGRYAPAWL